ncbi:uncharacterized protein CIMG_11742 [Coccidioides immitis RS]|uniref:Uncharacterized protein n=1 Tax=Coccidioides immitis (strain RS) TaxID=246410 RepID=A0A0D8JWA3_COCIM|nr:uncharacterized protein CIMG_11742 [Coccidioides immitis RS]KJF60568.1 hypothetical protein CIMG_11742 [Coccidioides immitis RS]
MAQISGSLGMSAFINNTCYPIQGHPWIRASREAIQKLLSSVLAYVIATLMWLVADTAIKPLVNHSLVAQVHSRLPALSTAKLVWTVKLETSVGQHDWMTYVQPIPQERFIPNFNTKLVSPATVFMDLHSHVSVSSHQQRLSRQIIRLPTDFSFKRSSNRQLAKSTPSPAAHMSDVGLDHHVLLSTLFQAASGARPVGVDVSNQRGFKRRYGVERDGIHGLWHKI